MIARLRICIAVPSITDFYFTQRRHSSLGAHLLAKLLTDRNHEVTLIDFPGTARRSKPCGIPGSLDHLDAFVDPQEFGPLAFFTGYRRLGPSLYRQVEMIGSSSPDLVILSCFAFAYAEDTLALAASLRGVLADIPIFAGGAGPSVHPQYYIDDTCIDTVAIGPAETTVDRLLEAYGERESGMPRIIGEHDRYQGADEATLCGSSRSTAADRASEPEFIASYSRTSATLTTIVSRGCPRRCRFCSVRLTQGSAFRKIAPEAFAKGLERFRGRGVRTVAFEDDSLLADPCFLEEILDIVRRFEPGIEVRAPNGLDPGHLTLQLLELLAQSRMRHLDLSLATCDPGSLEHEQRQEVSARLPELVQKSDALGMSTTIYWICGLELDTSDTIIDTLSFVASLRCASGISLFYPVPGLAGFENRELFARPRAILAKGSSAWPWTGALTTRQMITAFRLSRFLSLRAAFPAEHADLIEACMRDHRIYTQRQPTGTQPTEVGSIDRELEESFFGRLHAMGA